MADVDDFNQGNHQGVPANGGPLGGNFDGAPVLHLQHSGANSGTERVNPVMYREVEKDLAVFASKAGAPTNPDWYHNLLAHPKTTVELGTQTVPVTSKAMVRPR